MSGFRFLKIARRFFLWIHSLLIWVVHAVFWEADGWRRSLGWIQRGFFPGPSSSSVRLSSGSCSSANNIQPPVFCRRFLFFCSSQFPKNVEKISLLFCQHGVADKNDFGLPAGIPKDKSDVTAENPRHAREETAIITTEVQARNVAQQGSGYVHWNQGAERNAGVNSFLIPKVEDFWIELAESCVSPQDIEGFFLFKNEFREGVYSLDTLKKSDQAFFGRFSIPDHSRNLQGGRILFFSLRQQRFRPNKAEMEDIITNDSFYDPPALQVV